MHNMTNTTNIKKTGLEMAREQRLRHFELGYTVQTDYQNNRDGELLAMAQALIEHKYAYVPYEWDKRMVEKMMSKCLNERLAIAASLLMAEIDVNKSVGCGDGQPSKEPLTDEQLLEMNGWTMECQSPFEIRHKDGSFATLNAAKIILESIKKDHE